MKRLLAALLLAAVTLTTAGFAAAADIPAPVAPRQNVTVEDRLIRLGDIFDGVQEGAETPVAKDIRTIALDVDRGSISVIGEPRETVAASLAVVVFGGDESMAKKLVEQIDVALVADGSTIRVNVTLPKREDAQRRPQVQVTVKVPSRLASTRSRFAASILMLAKRGPFDVSWIVLANASISPMVAIARASVMPQALATPTRSVLVPVWLACPPVSP